MAVRRPGSVRVERQRRLRDGGAYGTTVRRRVVVAEFPWTRTKYTPAEREAADTDNDFPRASTRPS